MTSFEAQWRRGVVTPNPPPPWLRQRKYLMNSNLTTGTLKIDQVCRSAKPLATALCLSSLRSTCTFLEQKYGTEYDYKSWKMEHGKKY